MNQTKNAKEKTGKEEIRTLKRALDILLTFDLNEKKLTLTEIAAKISLAKSTTLRYITALERDGFLVKNEDNTYTLGYKVYYLGMVAKDSIELRKVALPIMQDLQAQSSETVNLYLHENDKIVCFEQIESTHALKRTVRIGDKFPIWSGASGKSILAFLEEEEVDRYLNDIRPYTDFTITDINEIKRELENIRRHKYAVSRDERELGVACVTAPIFDAYRTVIGSISMSGPSLRFTEEFVDSFRPSVYDAGKSISAKLGCRNY